MSDLRNLAADLSAAGTRAGTDAAGVVRKGALNVKKGWQQNVKITSGHSLPRLPYTIGYDLDVTDGGTVRASIGPDKGRGGQANLAALDEYGSVHNPPHMNGQRALDSEADAFEAHMARVAGHGL